MKRIQTLRKEIAEHEQQARFAANRTIKAVHLRKAEGKRFTVAMIQVRMDRQVQRQQSLEFV